MCCFTLQKKTLSVRMVYTTTPEQEIGCSVKDVPDGSTVSARTLRSRKQKMMFFIVANVLFFI